MGDMLGSSVGGDDGEHEGSRVGKPWRYVGASEGLTVGWFIGEEVGFGVVLPKV